MGIKEENHEPAFAVLWVWWHGHRVRGVEVKSTKNDHWTSVGNSILESTRVSDVERIYLTFGKLGGKPRFTSKPYEECLSGIAVTHMPRYLIDMRLRHGDTIFAKMNVTYDKLRMMDDPIPSVARYYRSQLKPGESMWWAGNPNETVSATIRLWKNVSDLEKRVYTTYGCVNFPEVFGGDYDGYSLWLTTQGVVDSHIRDQFSSGGRVELNLPSGEKAKCPGIYRRIKGNVRLLVERMRQEDMTELSAEPVLDDEALKHRVSEWIGTVSRQSSLGYEASVGVLETLLKDQMP